MARTDLEPMAHLQSENGITHRIGRWFSRHRGPLQEGTAIIAGVATVAAIATASAGAPAPSETPMQNGYSTNSNEQDNGSEQTAPPVLVFNGEFDVDASYVNNLHVTEFGGIKVSPDITYYRIPLGRVAKDKTGQEVLDVLAITPDGQAVPIEFPCDPTAKVGNGPQGGAIVSKEGTVVSLADVTRADGSHATIGELSQAIPGTGPLPTPQP